MIWRFTLLASLFLTTGNLFAGPEDTDAPEVILLVDQLGAFEFKTRTSAAKRLVKIGPSAIPILEAARNHNDPEVRNRLIRVLASIKANEARARVDAFRKDPSKQTARHLPGWKMFVEVVGDDEDSVDAFGRMFAAEQRLMEDHPIQVLANTLQSRLAATERQFATDRKPRIDSLHAFLLTSARSEIPVSRNAAGSMLNLVNSSTFLKKITVIRRNDNDAIRSRKIVEHWIKNCDAADISKRMTLALKIKSKSGLSPALDVLRYEQSPVSRKQLAILTIARLGSKKHISTLERLLKDPGNIKFGILKSGQPDNRPETRVADIALATIWHLNGQQPEDHRFPSIRRNSLYVFALNQIRFESEERRQEAFAEWARFKSERAATEIVD